MCRRNSCPSPAPWAAPSMRPGMSARTSRRCASSAAMPSCGASVRERIVRDLGGGAGDGGEERGLTGVGETDQADVGDELELEAQLALFALVPRRGGLGRLVGGGLEVLVPPSALAPLGDNGAVGVLEVVEELPCLVVVDQGAGGDPDDQVLGVPAVALFAAPLLTGIGSQWGRPLKSRRVLMFSSATRTTSAPLPPSPPAGPPLGMYFSRRRSNARARRRRRGRE